MPDFIVQVERDYVTRERAEFTIRKALSADAALEAVKESVLDECDDSQFNDVDGHVDRGSYTWTVAGNAGVILRKEEQTFPRLVGADPRQLAAILAGLRWLQSQDGFLLTSEVQNIACDAGPVLSVQEVDALCEALNR